MEAFAGITYTGGSVQAGGDCVKDDVGGSHYFAPGGANDAYARTIIHVTICGENLSGTLKLWKGKDCAHATGAPDYTYTATLKCGQCKYIGPI
jgi:hypothetical protein